MSKPVCTVSKNSQEVIKFNLEEFKGHKLLDVRVHCGDGKGGMVPTRKGISIPISLWPQIRTALSKMEEAIIEAGWLDKADLEPGG
ncbi:MAG: transcriptional coactivator p15/PC4 family protein [Syntrophobacterales bacterium]|jgi:hypothetical protein|nr:transcriptional coactivator p15/PC4 family protein [Syntrophobacterales bacterium]